jgi:hypothetical protein
MKKIILPLALAAALPLAADEPKATSATAAPAQEQQPAAAEPGEESPLVRAAKKARAGRKPTLVITNETLKKMGSDAKVTTTSHQHPVTLPPAASTASAEEASRAAAKAREVKASKNAEAEKAAAEKKQLLQEAKAAAMEEGEGIVDPAWLDEDGNLPEDFDPENPPEAPPL